MPATFVQDHFDRGLPHCEGGVGEIRRWSGRNVVVRLNAQAFSHLRSDAAFYADKDGPDECPLPIKRSAGATMGALAKVDIQSALILPEIDYVIRSADGCSNRSTYRVLPDSYVRQVADAGWSPTEPEEHTVSGTLTVRWPGNDPEAYDFNGDVHRDIEDHDLFDEIARTIAAGHSPESAVRSVLTQHRMEMAEAAEAMTP